jgi:AbiV family abortive infection protein
MCLDNARSYLDDADMYISNNKTDHLAIPIEFAMEEIGKAKIIFDKIEKNHSKILLSSKDGIYRFNGKWKKRGLGKLGSKEIEHLQTYEKSGK